MTRAFHIIDSIFKQIKSTSFEVQYWDYQRIRYGNDTPAFTIIFHNSRVLDDIIKHVSLGFGEGYMHGDIDVEGDWEQLTRLRFAPEIARIRPSLKTLAQIVLLRISYKNNIAQAKKNISFHYDLSNEFYEAWLDKKMVYSCAYFKDANNSIEQAQDDKLEYICRKLLLKPGQTLLDIGCGWGALVMYAVQKYGVKAHGITLSRNQLEKAKARIAEAGLEKDITLELIDYRELAKRGDTFDRIVSIGMMEHVGKDNIAAYMRATDKLLKPLGVGLLHTIGKLKSSAIDDWMNKYIFPGAYLPEPGELINGLRDVKLEVYHLENLQQHYALTLRAWWQRFEAKQAELKDMVSPEVLRAYRLYLTGCISTFTHGGISLYQVSFCKGQLGQIPIPLTNAHLHA
ncbi:MAG: class I SAM-dependent methyltransferase [Candidatus Abawacabacteria bacterium]|nr:class I SAM-dependent methyltransferase [Candidatus Abawacabacteria bacterium]